MIDFSYALRDVAHGTVVSVQHPGIHAGHSVVYAMYAQLLDWIGPP